MGRGRRHSRPTGLIDRKDKDAGSVLSASDDTEAVATLRGRTK